MVWKALFRVHRDGWDLHRRQRHFMLDQHCHEAPTESLGV